MNKKIYLSFFAGLMAGIICGLFGSGGGMILLPFLTLVFDENEVKARATTIFCVFFMVLISSFLYYKNKYIDWNISIKCAIGGIIGSFIGTKLLTNASQKNLKIIFILFLIYTGVKMIL